MCYLQDKHLSALLLLYVSTYLTRDCSNSVTERQNLYRSKLFHAGWYYRFHVNQKHLDSEFFDYTCKISEWMQKVAPSRVVVSQLSFYLQVASKRLTNTMFVAKTFQ